MNFRHFLVIGLAAFLWATNGEAAPPPRPEQPHPDQFEVSGFGNLAPLNPLNERVKAQQPISYRLLTMSGCLTGTIPQAMQRVEQEAFSKLRGFRLLRDDVAYDFTVRINCGSEQIRICGAINIFCLGRGFPYVVDVEMSDILSTYQLDTQLAIPLHEVIGHALGTWEEQYCKGTETTGNCKGLPQFTPAPGWVDVMNTGSNSRHGLELIELERWSRTMFDVLAPPDCSGPTAPWGGVWDACKGRWIAPDKWEFEPVTGIWYRPDGAAEWGACDLANRDCWNIPAQRWVYAGSLLFDPASGYFSRPPLP